MYATIWKKKVNKNGGKGISSLLWSLMDQPLPLLFSAQSENWVLQLHDAREELKAATGIEVTHLEICSFQERVGKPFIRHIKDCNIHCNIQPV